MKIKITILTENDKPVSALNGITEDMIKHIWQVVMDDMCLSSPENGDKATVISAEILGD